MKGSIEVKICIRLNQDVTPEVARRFVDEMEYEIKDTTGLVSIAETEVVEDNADDVDEDDGFETDNEDEENKN